MTNSAVDVIFLNGTSSSGKSTIAQKLQTLLVERDWPILAVDDFLRMLPPESLSDKERLKANALKLAPTIHQAIVAFVKNGIPVIVDHVLEHPAWIRDYQMVATDLKTIFVKIDCPLVTLEKREKLREDRAIGLAQRQYEIVHRGVPYNLEVNTDELSAEKCCQKIIDFIAK